jgi:hypothetical protein
MGQPRCGFVFKLHCFQVPGRQRINFPELGPDTESTRMSGEPDTVKLLYLPGWCQVVEKKPDSGPDFRLNRSRHPTAVGRGLVWRRIGSPPGDGWAARRDPEASVWVFYEEGLW